MKDKNSSSLSKLLEITNPLFFPRDEALKLFSGLTEVDFQSIFKVVDKPQSWTDMSDLEKIVYLTRGSNGITLRTPKS